MGIPIRGTFDAALARNQLRKLMAEQGWQPHSRARATAALTALTEIVVLSQTQAVLDIQAAARRGRPGVKLVCEVHWVAAKHVWLEQANTWLTRAADELSVEDRPEGIRLVATVWCE